MQVPPAFNQEFLIMKRPVGIQLYGKQYHTATQVQITVTKLGISKRVYIETWLRQGNENSSD